MSRFPPSRGGVLDRPFQLLGNPGFLSCPSYIGTVVAAFIKFGKDVHGRVIDQLDPNQRRNWTLIFYFILLAFVAISLTAIA